VPGDEFVLTRERSQHTFDKNLGFMLRDAFNELRRQLANHARRPRGEAEYNASSPHARVIRVFREFSLTHS